MWTKQASLNLIKFIAVHDGRTANIIQRFKLVFDQVRWLETLIYEESWAIREQRSERVLDANTGAQSAIQYDMIG